MQHGVLQLVLHSWSGVAYIIEENVMNVLINNKNLVITKMASIFLCIVVVICVCAVYLQAQSVGITLKDNDLKAKERFETTLKSLGGADIIEDIKSLIIKGKQTIVEDNETGEFEIRVLWPNDFIHIRRGSAAPPWWGVSQGKILAQIKHPPDNPPDEKTLGWILWRDMLRTAQIMMGTVLKPGVGQFIFSSSMTNPVALDMFLLPLAETNRTEIEFDSKTGYPSVIRHSESGQFGGGAVEYQFSSDRFPVGGVLFPRVIKQITNKSPYVGGGIETQEWRIEEVLINPKLSLKDFEVPVK